MSQLIPLTQGYSALVSDSDFPALSQFKWRYVNGYAARTASPNRLEYMHRVLMQPAPHQQVDHIDGDRLNNTRENLRLASRADNQRNKGVPRNSSTGFKGVGPYGERYHARIRVNGRRVHLGYWDDPEVAALVYDAAARRFHGAYACLNYPDRPALPEIEALLDAQLCGARRPKPVVLGPSRYRGVTSWRGRWRARISVAGQTLHLGSFTTEIDAAQAYDAAARLYHGAQARLNFGEMVLAFS